MFLPICGPLPYVSLYYIFAVLCFGFVASLGILEPLKSDSAGFSQLVSCLPAFLTIDETTLIMALGWHTKSTMKDYRSQYKLYDSMQHTIACGICHFVLLLSSVLNGCKCWPNNRTHCCVRLSQFKATIFELLGNF